MRHVNHTPILKTTLAAAMGLALATNALAVSVTVDSSLPANSYLNATTSQGSFSLAGQLNLPDFRLPYQINSASVSFSFADDVASELTLISQVTNPYTPTAVTSRVLIQTYADPAESADLSIGGQTGSGATPTYNVASHLDHTTVDWSYYANNCPGYVGACNHQLFQGTSFYYVSTSGKGGSFDIGFNLNAGNLATLAQTGTLDFALKVNGDLVLKSSRLTMDVSPNPLPPVATASVPEPEAIALLLAGLLVMGALKRQRARP